MNTPASRRKRRQAKQAMKHGPKAKPRHTLVGGRTGSLRYKQRAAARCHVPDSAQTVRLLVRADTPGEASPAESVTFKEPR